MLRKLFLTLAAPLVLTGCGDASQGPEQQALPVETVTIALGNIPNVTELPGRVEAIRTAEVRARVTGILQRQLYIDGSDVRQDQPLFEIDPAELRASYAQTQASLERARATAANARAVVERYRPLVKANAISGQEYDAAVAASREANANVAQIEAQLRSAGLQLGYTTVRAPISGRAGRAQVTEGALVSQTEGTLLTRIEQISPVYVSFAQSARDFLEIRRGVANGSVAIPDMRAVEVRLILTDGQEYPIPGTLDFLAQTVDETTGTVELRARFPNPDGDLLPGEFVRVRTQAGVLPKGIMIPQSAVILGENGNSVYVIDGSGKAAVRPVALGVMVGKQWIVKSGLTPGDKVIVSNIQKLSPGTPVQDKSAAKKAASDKQGQVQDGTRGN